MITPYENGRGCPKCRFAPRGCPSGCCVKPYHTLKNGEKLTPERKAVLHQERMERRRAASKSSRSSERTSRKITRPNSTKQAKTMASKSSHTLTFGETWVHKNTEIRIVSIKTREDGTHVLNVCVTPLNDDKTPRTRQLCNSTVNSNRKGQYGLPGYAQVASCSCMHCYPSYMSRQWSNDLRCKINLAIRHGKDYAKYEALIGLTRDNLIASLMEKMRIRYGIIYSAITWDDIISGRHLFEIDEIIPRQVLYIEENINDVDQWTRIFNHKNIQFLTKEDNVKKGSRIECATDLDVFSSIFSMEGARRVVIDSRLGWIHRRVRRDLELLDVEKEFFEIHDRSIFF